MLSWNDTSGQPKGRGSTEASCGWHIQPLNEWSGPQWSALHIVFICAKDSQMVEEMFFYLLKCSTVNSYILYQETCHQVGTKPLTALDFRCSVIEDLVQDHLQQCSRPTSGRPRLGPTPIRLNQKLHLLDQHSHFLQLCSLQRTDKTHNLLLLQNMPRRASTSPGFLLWTIPYLNTLSYLKTGLRIPILLCTHHESNLCLKSIFSTSMHLPLHILTYP